MTNKSIYEKLMTVICNPYGVCGLMGNIRAESGMKSTNIQNSYEKKLGMNDADYTQAVDNGTYTAFATDRVGYGLCQWTSSGRKAGLLDFARRNGVSIGNAEMQIDYVIQELNIGYKSVLNALKNAKSVREASDIVCTKYERPADQSEAVLLKRASYGQEFYDELVNEKKGQVNNMSSYVFKKNIANRNNYGQKRDVSQIKYIAVHYTGNDGDTDENNGKYFANNVVKASAHYFVDDDSVTQSVPDDYNAWAVGDKRWSNYKTTGGAKFYGIVNNTNSLSIEICDDVKNGSIYPSAQTISNAIALVNEKMKQYNIPKDRVIRHFDVSGKTCPAYWCGSAEKDAKWKSEFWNKLDGTVQTPTTPTAPTTSTYSLTQFVKDVQKATGAGVDGIAGKETLSKTVTVSAKKNSRHAVVEAIQKRLNSLGYDCGTADGIAGAKFTSAVNRYQKEVLGYKNTDGEITAQGKMWKKLLGMI